MAIILLDVVTLASLLYHLIYFWGLAPSSRKVYLQLSSLPYGEQQFHGPCSAGRLDHPFPTDISYCLCQGPLSQNPPESQWLHSDG